MDIELQRLLDALRFGSTYSDRRYARLAYAQYLHDRDDVRRLSDPAAWQASVDEDERQAAHYDANA